MITAGYVGLDLGGTGAKAGVFSDSGKQLGAGYCGYSPEPTSEGGAQIDIERIYEAAREAARQAVTASGVRVRAMAVSSQGETFVALDENDRPLHPAIMWYDSRAVDQAERLSSAISLSNEALPVVDAICSGPKIMWLRENCPDAMSRASRYLLLPEYFAYRLTGEAVTDPSTASSTALYADDAVDYSPDALSASGIDKSQLARIQQPGTPIARIRPEMAQEWGLDADTLVVTGTNDQYAGALGAGNCRPGIISVTTGTCLALVTLTRNLSGELPPGLFAGRFPIPEYLFVLAYSKTAGLVVQWFKDNFCSGKSLQELDDAASSVPIGSNGVTMLPHFDGMVSPVPNPRARGLIGNLSLSTGLPDIYRAILESVAFSLQENLDALRDTLNLTPEVVRCIGGGAKSDIWLQINSDVTGLPVERPAVTEAATLGAAMLAAVGDRRFDTVEECSRAFYRVERVFEPSHDSHALYKGPYAAYRDLGEKVYGR